MNFGVARDRDARRELYGEKLTCSAAPAGAPTVSADEGEIPLAILDNNLFGIDIDPTALWTRGTNSLRSSCDAR